MQFFLIYYFISSASGFTEIQKLITKSLIDQFEIKNCILASNTEKKLHTFNDFKLLSGWKIFSNVKTPTELNRYMHRELHNTFTEYTIGTKHKIWESSKKLLMPKTLVIFQDSNIDAIIKLFSYESTISRSAHYFTWVAFIKKSEAQFLNKIKISYATEFIAIFKENDAMYKLNEIYFLIQKVPCLINFGTWDEKNKLRINRPELSFYERRINMNKIVLYVAPLSKSADQVLNFFHIEVLEDMAKMMNTTIDMSGKKPFREIYSVRDLTYIMSDSNYVKDNVGPIIKTSSYLYIKEPNITTSNIYFLLPFSTHFWFALLIFITLTSIVNILIHLIFKQKYSEENIKWIDSVFKTLETFCTQNGGNSSSLYTSRVIDYTTNLLFIIILSAFSAVIQSHLIITISPPPFHNLDELLQQKTYSVGARYNGYEKEYFKRSPDPHYQNIYKILLETRSSLETGLAKACNERHAHMAYEFDVRNTKVKCKLFQIRDPVITRLSSIRFALNTYGMKKVFDYKLLWFYSSGIIYKMQKDLKGFEKESSSSNYFPVEINQIQFVMAIIAAGIFLGLILLIIDLIVIKCCKRKRIKI